MGKTLAILKVEYEAYDICEGNYALSSRILAIGEKDVLRKRATKATNSSWRLPTKIFKDYDYSTTFQLGDVVKEDPWYNEYFKELLEDNIYIDPETKEHIELYRDFMWYIRIYPVIE